MVVTILSKTGRKLTVGGKCFKESSKWLFTGLPTEFQAASVRLLGCFPCPKGRVPKAVLDKSDFQAMGDSVPVGDVAKEIDALCPTKIGHDVVYG